MTTPSSPSPVTRCTGVFLPLTSAQRAAELAAVAGLTADAVPSSGGVLLVPRSGDVHDAQVARLSRLLRGADVLVLQLAEERVDVQRWRAGRFVDNPSYGEVSGPAGDAERVLLGALPAAQAEGVVSADDIDRHRATRAIMSAAAGPVRMWQLVVTGVLTCLVLLLAVLAVLDLSRSTATSVWDIARLVGWLLLVAVMAFRLRGLLHRRRGERAAGQQEPPG